MTAREPFVRSAGSGPGVVCLHSNASSSSQWRALMELLAPRLRVLAVDSYGSGKSLEWPSDRVITLGDEVALIEPVLREARAVTRLLAATLPRVEVEEFAELGHMGPVTDPEPVNAAIARFLERL